MESLQKKIIIGLAAAVTIVIAVIGALCFSNRNNEQNGFKKVEVIGESEAVQPSESSEESKVLPTSTPYPKEETEQLPIFAEEIPTPAATQPVENANKDSAPRVDDEKKEEPKEEPQPTQRPADADKPIELPFIPFG